MPPVGGADEPDGGRLAIHMQRDGIYSVSMPKTVFDVDAVDLFARGGRSECVTKVRKHFPWSFLSAGFFNRFW